MKEKYLAFEKKLKIYKAPGLNGAKAENMDEFWNLPLVIALTAIDRFKHFQFTGYHSNVNNAKMLRCLHLNCNFQCVNVKKEIYQHIGIHLNI